MPSTVIRHIAYRPDARILDVEFTTGRRYLFRDVPLEAADPSATPASRAVTSTPASAAAIHSRK